IANAVVNFTADGLTPVESKMFSLSESTKAIRLEIEIPQVTQAGIPFEITVIAKNVSGNVDTSFTGTVEFLSSDPDAILPSDYTFTAGDQGQKTFTVTLNATGNHTISVRQIA